MRKAHKIEAGGVGLRGKTRLRARDKVEPTIRMREGIDRARQAHYLRPIPPGVMITWDGEAQQWDMDAPHRDIDGWEVQICEAFATRSHAVMWSFLTQLAEMVGNEWVVTNREGHWQPDEVLLNFALNVIHAEQPETPMQAMLCAQMVAVHLMQTKTAKRALNSGYDPRMAAVSGKLARTFAMQMDTLRRAKGIFPTQTVNVIRETHIHYHHDTHAHLHGGGGGENFGDQPQTTNRNQTSDNNQAGNRNSDSDRSETLHLPSPDRAEVIEHEGCATLLGEDASRLAVPVRSGEGKAPMPDARKRAGGGRAKG